MVELKVVVPPSSELQVAAVHLIQEMVAPIPDGAIDPMRSGVFRAESGQQADEPSATLVYALFPAHPGPAPLRVYLSSWFVAVGAGKHFYEELIPDAGHAGTVSEIGSYVGAVLAGHLEEVVTGLLIISSSRTRFARNTHTD